MGKKALITGAHGFVGRNVARQLASSGYQVTGIGHGKWGAHEAEEFGITTWHEATINLDSLVNNAGKPDIIIHCAGGSSVGHSFENPRLDFLRTVSSLTDLIEYSRIKIPKASIVYLSSGAIYGAVESLPIKENNLPNPQSPYGLHKAMSENLCKYYGKHFNLSIAVIRFFSIYGVGLKKQLLWDACCSAMRDDGKFSGTGEELRDWIHVSDAARLVQIAATKASQNCPIVNGGTGYATSVRDVVSEIFTFYSSNSNTPRFEGARRIGDPAGYEANIEMARSWGWNPLKDQRTGFREYVKWFKENIK